MAGWQLKLYGIALNGKEPDPGFVEATRDLAATVLPQPPAADDRYGVGFATAHDATSVYIALVYWWQSENELHQRIYVSPKDGPIAFVPVENQPAGCVWELEIVELRASRVDRGRPGEPGRARPRALPRSAASTRTSSVRAARREVLRRSAPRSSRATP